MAGGGGGSSYSAGTSTSFGTDTTGVPQVVIQYTLPTLTITADDKSMTYGGSVPALTASYSGFVNGDTAASLTTAPTCTTTATSHSPAGQYAITCSGAVDPNYNISYVMGTLTVNPAPLTITADDKTMTYGGSIPALTASYSGFVNGDTASSLTTAPTCTTTASSSSAAGSYAITCSGAADPNYSISYAAGTLTVKPAPLTITADDKSMTYGGPVPTFDASYGGLVNGDTSSVVSHLTCGATDGHGHAVGSSTPVGTYTIACSGGSAANYSISYAAGTLTIGKAHLTITADDKSMTYGGSMPALTASYAGLVNGDTPATFNMSPNVAPTLSTVPAGSDVGSYAITAGGAVDPDYTITYLPGTLTINPASLTITADNQTTPYGHVPAYTWTGSGWVNGDSAATLAAAPNSAPSCGATVGGTPDSATTPPGIYAGAITCQGAVDPNYTITYASGTLAVDPLLSLDEQGLPSDVPHRATLDGHTVPLPDGNVEVAYGSSHSYSFPATVTDSSGTVYITNDGGFSGVVTANISHTAVYRTVAQVVGSALSSGGIDSGGEATALTQQFAAVQADIKAGHTAQALTDLHTFAAHVRAQSGKHIATATAQALLADAQLVYASLGGTGTV